ncbi:MAG: hypothetical protein ACXVY3_01935 [Gaiellaceae bacterium]
MTGDALCAWVRSPYRAPLAVLCVVFAAARTWAWEAGVRFDASTLPWFWQFIDTRLLKAHLLQSLWYLHSQPPLYNLFLGIGLKVFGASFSTAALWTQLVIGLVITLALYALLVLVGLSRWCAVAVSGLFAVSPQALLFENWLFYEYVVAALLLLAVLAFVAFERHPSAWRSFSLFAVLACLCYIRISFQIVVLLLALAFMLAVFAGHRRAIAVGAVLPLLLVAGLMVKNWVMVGVPSTSSEAGMHLAHVDWYGFRDHQEHHLQERGVISAVSAVAPFSALNVYESLVKLSHPKTGIPLLDERSKPVAHTPANYDNIEYVHISRLYMHDFLEILVHEPSIYLRGVWFGTKIAVYPSDNYSFFKSNRSKINLWARVFDALVLWQPHVRWSDGVPYGTAWGIVVGYIASLLFGAREMMKVLLRRGGSLAVAFVWLLLVYVVIATTFGEAFENQRVRFVSDPLAVVLVAALASRLIAFVTARRRARTLLARV